MIGVAILVRVYSFDRVERVLALRSYQLVTEASLILGMRNIQTNPKALNPKTFKTLKPSTLRPLSN